MHVSFTFGRREILRILAVIVAFEILLVVAFLVESVSGNTSWTVHRLLNLDAEDSIATWFSTMQLAAAGILVALALLRRDRSRDPAPWFIVCIGGLLLAMSIDEGLRLHEAVTLWAARNDTVPSLWGNQAVLIVPVFALGVLLLAVSWRQLRVLWRNRRPALLAMASGLAVFFGGAVGLDTLAHVYLHDGGWLYMLEVSAEEFMELFGGTLMVLGGALFAFSGAGDARHAATAARVIQEARRAA